MLCSVCKKNVAVIFINKLDNDKKPTGETIGFCMECAKKKGIDPVSNIMRQISNMSEEDMENMSEQFDSMLNDINNFDDDIDDESPKGFALPNIFGNFMNFKSKKNSQSDESKTSSNNQDSKRSNVNSQKVNRKTKYLDTFGENLTRKARENKLDKVVGRQEELERMIQILNRRSKNNPALIGEPGVGKTAIVNALAIAIANGQVPSKLISKELYLIDMTSLIAGTQFRGQFESRIKGLIDECKSLGNIILAIDEVHNIVGGLEHDNSMNAANMLKPALANGSVQLIGATTLKEYRKYIEKDSALERRFQPIIVEEPSVSDCYNILKGVKEYYENYHKVKIPDDVLMDAVMLSDKYIHDRFLPDKAIDLIDEAAARVNLDDIILSKIEKLQNNLKNIQDSIEELEYINTSEDISEDDKVTSYEKLAKLKEEECKIEKELDLLNKKSKPRVVNFDDLAKVVELWTKIPVTRLKTKETDKLLALETTLKKRIIGQDAAIEAISNAIIRKRANIRNINRPPSFIFVGPTGVGKTELVKTLAYELFDDKEAIIKLDMSEYTEAHSTSKLIGAPPGYVGYDEAGQLTEKVRRNPYSIILFDEIEKAHPSIYNMLLQILDEGKLTDSQGKSVSFKHTIIVLTSNLGTNFKSDSYGFANSDIEENILQSKVSDALKEYFSPEFLNRIDNIVVFNKLSNSSIERITKILLDELKEETAVRHILFDYTDKVIKLISKLGYSKQYGARPLKRAIQKNIEDLIAIEFIKKNIKENQKFLLDVDDDKIVIKQ